jgi:hypothetical protein
MWRGGQILAVIATCLWLLPVSWNQTNFWFDCEETTASVWELTEGHEASSSDPLILAYFPDSHRDSAFELPTSSLELRGEISDFRQSSAGLELRRGPPALL